MARPLPIQRSAAEWALLRNGRLRVGLMGGSFNPAHAGHLHISLQALKRLRLDVVWWLVSPQNPLKASHDMAPFAERLEMARRVARHPHIRVSAIEAALGSRYSVDSAAAIRRLFPALRCVWLMGADNFTDLHKWRRWTGFVRYFPIAVLARPGAGAKALASPAAARLARYRLPERKSASLIACKAPRWSFLHIPLHFESATRIRMEKRRYAIMAGPSHPSPPIRSGHTNDMAKVESMLALCLSVLESHALENIVTIPLIGRTSLADYMLIASGRAARQLIATAQDLAFRLKEAGASDVSIEGISQGDWLLVDAQDIILHLFRPEVRDLYALEKLWGEGRPLTEMTVLAG